MSHVDPFNAVGGFSVGIPPELVIDETGNVVNNVNAPNSNVTANRVFANAYLYANGDPLSIGASGSNRTVQFNNNGLLGGSNAFTFNSTNNLLSVTNLAVLGNANLGNVATVKISGGINGYFLQTDGTGNLTWAPAGNGGNGGNGSPAGANTQVQFNNEGNFGGDAGFTYDSTTNLLTVGNINTGNITANYIVTNWDVTANVVIANYLYGDGSNISNVVAVSAATANSVAGANVTGQVNFAAVANSVAGANVTGQVNFANVANNVAGANVSGQVGNALVAGTVYTSAQPNITSIGNLTSLTVIGNTTLGNQVVANFFIGNLFGTANLARNVTLGAQPNITSVGTLTSLTVSGNTTLGNSATANYFVGNLYGVANSAITANTATFAANANIANYALTANIANSTEYTNVANYANVAYSVDGSNVIGQVANALIAGTVYSNAQPNITSVGTLSSLSVTGNITAGNVTANIGGNGSRLFGLIGANVTGTVANANYASYANIAQTTNVALTATTAGTVTTNAQPNITSVGELTSLIVTGNMSAGNITSNFIGNGSRISNITGSNVIGNVASAVFAFTANTANVANTATSANTAVTVTQQNQPNINSVGNLLSLNVIGNIIGSNNIIADEGFIRANYFVGQLGTSNQPNITNVGTLTSLSISGVANLGNVGNVKILGGINGYVLSTDGAGNLSWVVQSNGGGGNATPAGSNTQIQYNDGGIFGATGNFTWNNLTRVLFVGGNANIEGNLTARTLRSNVANGTAPLVVESTTPVANLAVETAATVRNAAQPNITSVGTLTLLNVAGNLTSANANVGNLLTANFVTGTLTTNAQPNITSVGTLTGLNVSSNITAVNITANTGIFIGNGSGLTNIAGANVVGTVANATYALNAGNATNANSATTATTAVTVTGNAQPNITSVGILSSLGVTGNVIAGNLNANNVVLSSNGSFFGNGSGLTSLNASNISSGILSNARLTGFYDITVIGANTANTVVNNAQPNITSVGTLTGLNANGNIVAVNITANTGVFTGNGSGLTNLVAANIIGTVANANYALVANTANSAALSNTAIVALTVQNNNQPNITSVGVLTNLNVSGNVLAGNLNANNVILSSNGSFFGNGSGLSALNASNITSGFISNARLFGHYDITVTGSNTANTVVNNAQPNITSVGNLTGLTVNGISTLGSNANVKITGGNSGFVLSTDGTGNLSWVAQSGGGGNTPPGGSNTQIQYNSNGTFAGTANFTWNNNTNLLNVVGNINTTNTIVAPNVTASNITTTSLTATGNVSAANISATLISGTLTTNVQPNINQIGTLGYLNINTSVSNSNGNITFNGSLNGIGTSSNIIITGNINAGNFVEANYLVGTLTTSAQPNITSIGPLTNLNVTGSANLGNVANITITGGNNGYVLSTDGTGNLSWVAQSGGGGNGSPGGSNTQIQYNDSGLFAGSSSFTWNNTTKQLTVGGNLTVNNTVNATNIVATTGNFVNVSASGNITAGNVSGGNLVSANFLSGTLTTASQLNINYLGNVGWLNVNTSLPNSNGNITFNGSLNGTGISSNITITGNVNAGNFIEAERLIGSLTTAAQPNITSVGNLTGLTVNGITNLGNVGNFKLLGGTNGYVLSTDGAGNLDWIAQSGGGGNTLPGGSNTFIQFNDSNTFNGVANFTFNKTTSTLFVGGNANISGVSRAQVFVSTANTGSAPFIVNSTTPVANLAVETAATVRNNAQPNITSLGTLTSLAVSGNISAGNLSVSNTFTAPNISVSGTIGTTNLNVTGTANFSNNAVITGSGNLVINGRFNAANSSNVFLGNVANVKITGGINGYVLTTDGAGNLSWSAGGGGGNGTPGGSNTQVQYNKAGTFGGSSFFTFNDNTSTVQISGTLISNGITVGSGAYEFAHSNVYFATTSSTAPNQTILAIDVSGNIGSGGVAAVDYTIISTDNNIRNFIKISCVRVGSSVNYVEYSTLPVNGYTGDFSVVYNPGNVSSPASIQLKLSPQSANLMTHKMMVTTYYD